MKPWGKVQCAGQTQALATNDTTPARAPLAVGHDGWPLIVSILWQVALQRLADNALDNGRQPVCDVEQAAVRAPAPRLERDRSRRVEKSSGQTRRHRSPGRQARRKGETHLGNKRARHKAENVHAALPDAALPASATGGWRGDKG